MGLGGFLKATMPKQNPGVPRGVSWMVGRVINDTCISENSLKKKNGQNESIV